MKEKPKEMVILPPHTTFALHSRGIAELYKASIFFLLWMWLRRNIFYSTFNNMETGI